MFKINSISTKILCIITIVITFFASCVLMFNIIYIPTTVSGTSMQGALNDGDRVYINRFASVERGDIVVLKVDKSSPISSASGYIIKRLIGKAGDNVRIEFNAQTNKYDVIVNNETIYSKPKAEYQYNTVDSFIQYVNDNKTDITRIQDNGVVVKQNEVFLLGDNWNISQDSSLVGPLKSKGLVGRIDITVNVGENDFFAILKRIFS